MQSPSLSLLLLFSLLYVLGNAPSAEAQPSVPATFFGTVAVNGEAPPDGTEVRGFVAGTDCTQVDGASGNIVVADGVAQYSVTIVHESQVPGCGAEGRAVTFTVGGEQANQAATWSAGTERLDLSVGEGDPPPLPTATSVAGTSTPRPLPTDDVDPSGLVGGQPGSQGSRAGDNSVLPWILTVIGLAIVVGVIAGMTLSRRKRTTL